MEKFAYENSVRVRKHIYWLPTVACLWQGNFIPFVFYYDSSEREMDDHNVIINKQHCIELNRFGVASSLYTHNIASYYWK